MGKRELSIKILSVCLATYLIFGILLYASIGMEIYDKLQTGVMNTGTFTKWMFVLRETNLFIIIGTMAYAVSRQKPE